MKILLTELNSNYTLIPEAVALQVSAVGAFYTSIQVSEWIIEVDILQVWL